MDSVTAKIQLVAAHFVIAIGIILIMQAILFFWVQHWVQLRAFFLS
jgi:hypothetical protein